MWKKMYLLFKSVVVLIFILSFKLILFFCGFFLDVSKFDVIWLIVLILLTVYLWYFGF